MFVLRHTFIFKNNVSNYSENHPDIKQLIKCFQTNKGTKSFECIGYKTLDNVMGGLELENNFFYITFYIDIYSNVSAQYNISKEFKFLNKNEVDQSMFICTTSFKELVEEDIHLF